MPSIAALLHAYGNILIPGNPYEMPYREALARKLLSEKEIRKALHRLYRRDCADILREEVGDE